MRVLNLIFIVFLIGCNSTKSTTEKYYADLKALNPKFTDLEYNGRVGIPNIQQSVNELEIRRYKFIALSQTTNLILLFQNENKCDAQIFAESNVPKIKIHNIDTSNMDACGLIENLLKNNVHRLTDFSVVIKELTKEEPLPIAIEDGFSYLIQVKIMDKIYEMSYSDFEPHLELFPKNKELNEYEKVTRIYDGITL